MHVRLQLHIWTYRRIFMVINSDNTPAHYLTFSFLYLEMCSLMLEQAVVTTTIITTTLFLIDDDMRWHPENILKFIYPRHIQCHHFFFVVCYAETTVVLHVSCCPMRYIERETMKGKEKQWRTKNMLQKKRQITLHIFF